MGLRSTGAGDTPRLDALTGLRVVVALLLVYYHFAGGLADQLGTTLEGSGWPAVGTALRNLLHSGYLGTGFFFLLSGFILTYRNLEGGARRLADPRGFWIARLSRLYPAYLVGFVLVAPTVIFDQLATNQVGPAVAKLVVVGGTALTLLQAWTPLTSTRWNFPTWGLSAEVFFYALFPLLALRVFHRPWRRVHLVALMAGAWAVSLVPGLVYLALNPDHVAASDLFDNGAHLQTSFWMRALKFTPLLRLPEFVFGMAAGRLFLKDREEGRRVNGTLLTAIAGVLGLGVLFVEHRLPYPLTHNGFFAPLLALFLYGLAHGGRPAGLLARRPFVRLGEASFAICCLHVPIGGMLLNLLHLAPAPLRRLLLSEVGHGQTWRFMLVFSAFLLALAVATHELVEVPLRPRMKALLERVLYRKRLVRVAVAQAA